MNPMKLPLVLWSNVVGLIITNKFVCLLCLGYRETLLGTSAQRDMEMVEVKKKAFDAVMLLQDSHFCKLNTSLLTLPLCLLAGEQRFPSAGVSIIYEAD